MSDSVLFSAAFAALWAQNPSVEETENPYVTAYGRNHNISIIQMKTKCTRIVAEKALDVCHGDVNFAIHYVTKAKL